MAPRALVWLPLAFLIPAKFLTQRPDMKTESTKPLLQQIDYADIQQCMHCGMCTALCTTKALAVDPQSRTVVFDAEKCSGCGLCVKVCPVQAMEVDMENGALQ